MCAGYLFQTDKQYDVAYDTGDKAIQCGRHVDIFKFWLMWKAKVLTNMVLGGAWSPRKNHTFSLWDRLTFVASGFGIDGCVRGCFARAET